MKDEIKKAEKQYGDLVMSMALFHLLHTGIDNIKKENIDMLCEDARNHIADNAILSPEYQEKVLRCAYDLARCGCNDILRYVKFDYPIKNAIVREGMILSFLCNATGSPIVDILVPSDTSDEVLEEVLNTYEKESERYDIEHNGDMSDFNIPQKIYDILCRYTTPTPLPADKTFYL